jgi:hypothetical protein
VGLLLDVAEQAGPRAAFLLPPPGPARRVLDLTGVTAALDQAPAGRGMEGAARAGSDDEEQRRRRRP